MTIFNSYVKLPEGNSAGDYVELYMKYFVRTSCGY